MSTLFIVVPLLTLLAMTGLLIARTRDLWAAIMLTGIYSFLGASWMLILDAPDVAFTEAAVGAGISTVLMLGTLALTGRSERKSQNLKLMPLLIVVVTGAALVYGTFDMPRFGDADAPIHTYPDPSYVEASKHDIHVDNVDTAVLASYRGYDTLGETVVIFTAGMGVTLLLRRSPGDSSRRIDNSPAGPNPPKTATTSESDAATETDSASGGAP